MDLDEAPMRVVLSPMPTMFALTRDAVQQGRLGTPANWRKAVVAQLRARHAEALAPLADRLTTGWPSFLDDPGTPRETVDEALQRLAATASQTLIDALEQDRDVTPSSAWDPVRRDPDRWLRAYVEAMHQACHALAPLWRRSLGLLQREEERLNAAIDRGVPRSQVINELILRATLVDDALLVAPSAQPRRLSVDRTGVIVSPMIAGSASTIASPGECFVRFAYPVHEVWRAFDDKGPPAASLEALVGKPRAAFLRRLDRPLTAGALAEISHLAPAAVTYHVQALEAAGLVARQRRGRNVIVHRTSRGTGLLALYPGDA
jgi:DNA-binding transcriptional ArsR family regulator